MKKVSKLPFNGIKNIIKFSILIMKQVFYWSPFIGNVATIKAVINSAFSISKYSKDKYLPSIINSSGEWNEYKNEINEKKIKSIDLQQRFKINTKINGFIRSRLEFLKIFINCYFPLKNLIKKNKPDYLIVHLITSLPLILYLLNDFDTKLIVRISGKVKLNFFRKALWKLNKKNIFLITCPTKQSLEEINSLGIIEREKIIFLPDPIIDISDLNKKKRDIIKDEIDKKYFLSIGRFTKQKNHKLLINAFANLKNELKDIELVLIGDGELRGEYIKTINKLNLEKKIHIIGFRNNVFPYLRKSLGIISTSLWEDPGFVMIEAAACNTLIISSDCPSGPKEFVSNSNGLLFKNNSLNDLVESIKKYMNTNHNEILKMKIGAKKQSVNFTKLRHFKILNKKLI